MMKNKWTLVFFVSLVFSSFSLSAFAGDQFNFWQPTRCVAPTNINYAVSPDRKQVTFAWQANANSEPILNFQINDASNIPIWTSLTNKPRCHSLPLPGRTGRFIFYFYSRCTTGFSTATKFQVNVV